MKIEATIARDRMAKIMKDSRFDTNLKALLNQFISLPQKQEDGTVAFFVTRPDNSTWWSEILLKEVK